MRARVSPATRTVLRRAVAPATTVMEVFGTRHALASSAITASFALPPSGDAVTATLYE